MNLLQIIKDNNQQLSSMRFGLLIVILLSVAIVGAICYHIVSATKHTATIDWIGISTAIGAVSALLGLVFYNKVQQKKIETDEKPTAEA